MVSFICAYACVCLSVCVCVRACTHAAGGSGNPPRVFKHKPGLLVPSLWSKPCPGGDPTLEDCDILAHETHFRRGWGGGALCLNGRATHLHPQDRMEQDRTGASPKAGTGIAVGSGQLWSSRARKHLFLLSKPLSDTPGHFFMTAMPLGHPQEQGTAGLSRVPCVQPAGQLLAQPHAAVGASPPCCWRPGSGPGHCWTLPSDSQQCPILLLEAPA